MDIPVISQSATLEDLLNRVEEPNREKARATLEGLEAEIIRLKAKLQNKKSSKVGFIGRKRLLGVEKKAQELLRKEIRDLEVELSETVAQKERLLKYRDYSTLSLEPLKWRDQDKNPVFAILDPKSPTMSLKVISWYGQHSDEELHPDLPRELSRLYNDVLARFSARGKAKVKNTDTTRVETTIKTSYAGMVPGSTKKKIKEAKKIFPYIFFITQGAWEETEIAQKDPLVVGFDPGDDCFYLIDQFDLQPAERHWVEEFPEG